MKKTLKQPQSNFPMPVLMVATYNDDGSVDVMNAAWGTMQDFGIIALQLDEKRKTVKNIKARKGFTISLADAKHCKEADYFGLVSGNNTPDKFERSGLTATPSELVDAPIINEFPVVFECEFIEYQDDEYGMGVIGRIVRTAVEEEMFDGDKLDVSKLQAIAFDPFTNGYYLVSERVGEAFKEGLALKK